MRAAMRLGVAALAACAASACVSGLKSNVPAQQLYVLRAPPAAAAPPAGAVIASGTASPDGARRLALEVLHPITVPALDTDGIALLLQGNRVDYFASSRWAGQLPLLVQTLAIDVLRGSGRFRAVESDGTPFVPDQLLRIEIRHFEAEYTDDGPPTIHVGLIGTLGQRSGRTLLGSVTADSSVRADANRMEAVVSAFERATDDALMQLLAQWPQG